MENVNLCILEILIGKFVEDLKEKFMKGRTDWNVKKMLMEHHSIIVIVINQRGPQRIRIA